MPLPASHLPPLSNTLVAPRDQKQPVLRDDRPRTIREFFSKTGVLGIPRYYELFVTAFLAVMWYALYSMDPGPGSRTKVGGGGKPEL